MYKTYSKLRKIVLYIIILALMLSVQGCTRTNDVEGISTGSISPGDSPTDNNHSESETVHNAEQSLYLEEYNGPIHHVFFHCLIAFPEIAYSDNVSGLLDTDCVTVSEFKRSLDQFYKNNFILVDINSTFDVIDENGQEIVKDKKLMLPPGKKPLVMSIDDIVYDPKKMGWGMVDKIILDKDGNFATYTKHKDGQEIISYDNEVIPILEQFVSDHPDFSLNGAKATLAVTGWVGILGYRIDRLYANRQNEIEAVTPIVERLKERGWNFASHGYGHRHSNQISYNLFADDTQKWRNEIESVIGPTRIYVYPYGEELRNTDPKYKLLLDYGFKVICGVHTEPVWQNFGHSVFMSRQCIDGYSLRNYKQQLSPLLDTATVFDPAGRK